MEHVYIGRQVILDKNSDIFAYELLYRDTHQEGHVRNDRCASSTVIHHVLNLFGADEILGDKKAFIKIDEKFLLSDLIWSVPSKFFIFSLFEKVEMNERVIERIEQLYDKGYELAVSDAHLDIESFVTYNEVFRKFSYFKVDFTKEDTSQLSQLIEALQEGHIKVVCSKIDTYDKYQIAQDAGCDYFQGYFFAKPKLMKRKNIEPTRIDVLRLYNLLMQDVNIDEITDEFEKSPEVTVQLLQFINSSAFHFSKPIASIHHVITLLGRIKLAEWLMLMIYSKSVGTNIKKNPLIEMVLMRTKLMETITKLLVPDAGSNLLGEAYFTGMLSLIDTVLDLNLQELLEKISISDDVRNALLYEKGLLGDIFQVVKAIEKFDVDAVMRFERTNNLPKGSIKNALLSCMECEGKIAF